NESGITITERFEYDHQNRLLVHKHQVDDKPEQILAENSYNELSQLKNKKVGNNLQSIDYSYNIRGWLTDINKDQMSVPDLGGKLFSYKIKYNQMDGLETPDSVLFNGRNVKPKYNGNIAEVDWRAVESLGANPSITPKRYGYAYDALNRLTAGYYQNPVNPYSKEHTESIAYDLNGNITGLYRTSALEGNNTTATVIDNLEYIYGSTGQTNQVSVIKDHQNNPSGYEGGGGTIQYDLNGSMWQIPDKNITKITYNYLNLPDKIEYGNMGLSGIHNYLYRADGTKVQKKLPKAECGIINCYTITDITDYLDGFQYYHNESSNNGGGGGLEELRMITEKLKYAYEQQAFS
ncbi:RHS repeat-associated core domain-containing protein, partial [Chryseobacterium sp. JK1]